MKKTILAAAFIISGFAFQTASAQIRVGLNINIGSQPVWGPVGYDHAEYYYMPDIDAYYNIPNRQYIYQERGRWVFAASLPYRFHYDLYTGYKVVVNEPRPYLHPEIYRSRYSGYRGNHSQQVIRNSHDSRYYQIKDHPEHNNWQQEQNRQKQHGKNNHNRRD